MSRSEDAAGNPQPRGAVTALRILTIALPVVLSNATVPIQGAVDTALIGQLGVVAALAGVGLAAAIFDIALGSLNFLQMGTSGLSAQALGSRAHERLANTLLRGLIIGGTIGLAFILLQTPVIWLGLTLFEASSEAETIAAEYFHIRIWGAPAELMNYALLGWFTGQEMTRRLFQHQLVLTLSNIALNLLFVLVFDWGVAGVALGTLIASVLGLLYGLWIARARIRVLVPASWRPSRDRLLKRDELLRLLALNRDIFIRTLLLIGGFAWMTRMGSMQGDVILAANVVLMQFFFVSSYALDGFAMAAETLVGQAMGAHDLSQLDRAAWMSSLCSGALSLLMSIAFVASSGPIIDLFTTAEEVRTTARDYFLWAALIPLAGFGAFQMDGIFIGATGSVEMRNSMIVSSAFYFPISYWMLLEYGNHGIWAAVWIWLILRALTLLALYPRIRARAESAMAA
ncbi:MAG: MATE family efflux transporter [Pseudomonadota bacterium]